MNDLPDRPSAPETLSAPAFNAVNEVAYSRTPPVKKSSIEDVLDVFYRSKWIILFSFVMILGAAAIHTFTVAPEYEAYSLLLVDTDRSSDISDVLSDRIGALTGKGDHTIENEMVILRQSLPLAQRVAARLLALPAAETRDFSILEAPDDRKLQPIDVVNRLQSGYIKVSSEGRDNDVIRITAGSTNPTEAALLANLYAREFLQRTQESSRSRVAASRTFLEDQVEKRRGELRSIEEAIKAYMSREGAVALNEEASQTVSQTAQLEAARDEARVELGMQQASLRALEQELAAISPNIPARIASGVEREIESTQSRIAELEITLEQIFLQNPALRRNPSGSAEVTKLQADIAGLRSRVEGLSRQYVQEVIAVGGMDPKAGNAGLSYLNNLNREIVDHRVAISGLQAKAEALDARLRSNRTKLKDIPVQSMSLAQLQRSQQSTESMYLFLVEKLQETRLAEESELGYAEVIRPAVEPTDPVRPRKAMNLGMGAFLGLVLGLGIAIVRRQMDRRIFRPDELREAGYPLVGVIPDMTPEVKKSFGQKTVVEIDGRSVDPHLLALLTPMSGIAETYRHMRTNLQFSRPDAVVSTIVVTSTAPGEGKSTTAANLAVVMAQTGRRTLLIDADLRRPAAHKLLGLRREPGLVETLFATEPIDFERLSADIDDLYFLPSGRITPNPSELLGSRRMREFLESCRQAFDVIIIDTPPVLSATDATLLATQADTTVVVTRAGATDAFALHTVYEALDGVGARVAGVVLNRFDAASANAYKYRYRNYAYGQAYGHPTAG